MLIALVISIFTNITASWAAFGVSPPWLKNDVLLPGSTIRETIYLTRNITDQAMKAEIKITGNEKVVEWVTIPNQDNLIMRAGEQVLPMLAIINIPEDAESGTYTGSILITLNPLTEDNGLESGQVGITLGAYASVELTVVDEAITDYAVNSVSLQEQEEPEPFSVNVNVKNTGNTEINELEGQIQVVDRSNGEIVKTLAFLPPSDPIAFNETEEVAMVYNDFVPEKGEYLVEIEATKDGETIYKDRLVQKVGLEPEPAVITETSWAEEKDMYLIAILAGMGLALLVVVVVLLAPVVENKRKIKR